VQRIVRAFGRKILRMWGRVGKAPGWHYEAMERLGPLLADENALSTQLVNGCRVQCDLRDHVPFREQRLVSSRWGQASPNSRNDSFGQRRAARGKSQGVYLQENKTKG